MAIEIPILRAFNLIVADTENQHLAIAEMRTPTFQEKSFDFTPGGGSLELDVPLGVTNKLECPFKLASSDPRVHGLYGLPPGERTPFTARKFIVDENSGREIEAVIDMKGRLMKVEAEQMKGGDKAGYDHTISSITWYQEMQDGKVWREFNFFMGGWRIRNGQPANAGRNRILGIG